MTDLTRRDFLKFMGLGTAGIASALALASCSNGDEPAGNSNNAADPGSSNTASSDTSDVGQMETTTTVDLTTSGSKNGDVKAGPDGGDKRTLVVAAAKATETLDPFYATGAGAQRLATLLYAPMWDLAYGGSEDVGVGVKSWSLEDDDTTVVFELHDNIYDHNGNQYTMDDVMWYREYYTGVVGKKLSHILDMEKIDTYKGKIKMKLPYYPGYLTASIGFNMFTQASYEAAGDEGFRNRPVGTLNYKCIDFVSGASSTFEHTYEYWGNTDDLLPHRFGNTDFVRLDVITEESQIATALRTNTIQGYDIQVSTAEDFLADPGNVDVKKYPSLYPSFLQFNMYPGSIFADNKALREAIAYGINWEDVAYAATMGHGSYTGVIGHDALAGYNKDWETDGTAWHYDKELAKQKLEEAGYKPGELTIKFTYNQTPNDFAVMQQNLDEIGITLEMELLDEVTYMTRRGQANTLEWDIMGHDVVPKGFITNIFYNMSDNTSYEWGQVNGANDQEMYDLAVAARYGTQEDIDKAYHALVERVWYIPRFNGNSFIGSYNKIEQIVVDSSQELVGQAALFADDYDIYY